MFVCLYVCVHACSQAFALNKKKDVYDGKTFRHRSSALPRYFSDVHEAVLVSYKVIQSFLQESMAIFLLHIQTFNKQHRNHKATCTTAPKKGHAPYVTL